LPFCRADLVACTNTGYIINDACHRGKAYFRYNQHITCYILWQNPCISDVLPRFSRKLGKAACGSQAGGGTSVAAIRSRLGRGVLAWCQSPWPGRACGGPGGGGGGGGGGGRPPPPPPRPDAKRRSGELCSSSWAWPAFGVTLPTGRRTNGDPIPTRNIGHTLACGRKASGTAMHPQLPASPTPLTIRPAARSRQTKNHHEKR
jgi:hypothetical protein